MSTNDGSSNALEASSPVKNKPIKKKAPGAYDQEDSDSTPSSENNYDSRLSVHEIERKERNDLCAFLTKKGVDASLCEDYKIHVRMKKVRKSGSSSNNESSYSISFSCPDGSHLTSRNDVLTSINDIKRKREIQSHKSGNTKAQRDEAYKEARHNYCDTTFPIDIDGITVLSLGVVKDLSEFSSLIQIYLQRLQMRIGGKK